MRKDHDIKKGPTTHGGTRSIGWIIWLGLSPFMLDQPALALSAKKKKVPPSWNLPTKPQPVSTKRKHPWYIPKVALGSGLNFPEIIPLEATLLFGDYVGLRFFGAPAVPFKARVEMPSDVISTKKGLGVANPDFTINLDARYGPQMGFEAMIFPGGSSFYLAGGLSTRTMSLSGKAQSRILVCSLIEAAKEPPCGNPDARIETLTELKIDADVSSSATLARGAVGGFWHIGEVGYLNFIMGITSPLGLRRTSRVVATIDTPAQEDNEITGALAEIKKEKEVDLEKKALREMHPVDERILPLVGLTMGVRL